MRRLPVIVNPASGPDQPVLKQLNRAFRTAGRDWEILLTRQAGDAHRLAAELRAAGEPVIAICGGDGTLKEAAGALAGGEAALAILPGGTGNALATELGIPLNLEAAAALACQPAPALRAVDLGQIGEHLFVLRASLGLETELLRGTDRALKDHLGPLAYPLTALQRIGSVPFVDYRLTIDGREIDARGVQCTIANSAQMGVTGLALAQGVNVSDGLLDVIVLSAVDVPALIAIATSNFLGQDTGVEIQHWQGREVTVAANPPQAVALGGEIIGETPATARVVPAALRVVVPG
jgi:YegS/Rv2252/BmrU family lipid kinase